MSASRTVRTNSLIGSLFCVVLALTAGAQTPDTQYPPASYPQTTYPQTAYPQPNYPQPGKRPNPLRQLFAGTLSALIQGSDPTGLVNNVVQGLSGSLTSWFERRQQRKAQAAAGAQAPAYPNTSAGGYPSTGTYPATPATGGYPATTPTYDPNSAYTYPSAATPQQQGYPYAPDPYATSTYNYTSATANSYDWSTTQVYDQRTGQATSAQSGYALAAPPADATAIVAGGAYDVYALRADGSEMPVNAATHEFRSGDRFKVYFRPSLPGRLEVSNINPYGRESKIDSTETAAGQLTTLGPYEFTATKGNEALRFVLWPCSSPQLMVASRDIVNVSGNAGAGYPASGFTLGACSTIATRSVYKVRTRDIVKVGVDGTTSFALDPVSQAELSSGQFTPREFTIYFRHL